MDFELIKKFANDIAREYVTKRIPIEESVLQFCQENKLNPEQVRNIVQLINTLIHLLLFENKTDDKIVEFDPLDPDILLRKLFQETPPNVEDTDQETISVDLFDDMSPLLKSLRARFGGNTQKVVDLSDIFGPGFAAIKEETTPTTRQKQLLIMKVQKTAEELKMRYLAAGAQYCEFLDNMATKFAALYGPDIDEFAKEAYIYRGEKALPVLQDIYSCLKKKLPNFFEKRAAVVDASKEEFQILDAMIQLEDEYRTTKLAWEKLNEALNNI